MRKKLLVTFSATILASGIISSSVFAQPTKEPVTMSVSDVVTQDDAFTQASNYVKIVGNNSNPNWKEAKVDKGFPLFDFDRNVTAFLFSVFSNEQESGYVVVSANKALPGILESTRTGTHPYVGVEKDAIYVGPLMHYTKKGDSFVDLHEKKTLQKSALKSKGPLAKENIWKYSKATTDSPSTIIQPMGTITNYSYKLMSGVSDYQWYIGCAPTSGANIVTYWDNNGKSNLVADHTSTNTLIDNLATAMSTNRSTGGTSVNNMVSGMTKYWKDRGYTVTVSKYSNGTFTDGFGDHQTEINNNRPDWVTTASHPTYGDHAMTGVGYEDYYSYDDFSWHPSVIVHDTWSNTSVDIWLSYNSYFDYTIAVIP